MHFITGGAFNGKRNWVLNYYQLDNIHSSFFISSYENQPLLTFSHEFRGDFLILEGMELWVKELIERGEAELTREILQKEIFQWIEWENESHERNLIIIGTDITKGIVPIDSIDRTWRDLVGWVYQDVVSMAKRVDLVWYGINQRLK